MAIDSNLLAHISNISNLPQILSLRNQGLSGNDIQSLVTALKQNTHITELDLTDNHIGDDGAILLSQINLVSLIIAHNQISEVGAFALALNKTIKNLDISHNQVGDEGIIALGQNTVLSTLKAAGNKISNEGVSVFINNSTLKSLDLMQNQISNVGAIHLAQNKSLIELNLSGNQIGNPGVIELANHPTLQTLILCRNQMTAEALPALAQNKTLTILDIGYNLIGATGAKAFITIKNTALRTLGLAGNQINNWGVIALAQNENIRSLDVSYNQIGDKGIDALIHNKTLRKLDVSYNQITSEGAQVLLQHPQLMWLNISHNNLGDKGVAMLAQSERYIWLNVADNQVGPQTPECFIHNTKLISLTMSHNPIGDKGAIALAKNNTLRELLLSYCKISNPGAFALACNGNFTRLTINYNCIGPEGRESLKKMKTLKYLEISTEQPPVLTSENLSMTFLLSQDFLCIRSLEGIIQYFNPAFSRILGYMDDELLGKSYYTFLHPENRLKEEEEVVVFNQKFPISNQENRYRCKDGSYRFIRWSSQTQNGRVYAVGTDITVQKQIEKEILIREKKIESSIIKDEEAKIYAQNLSDFIAHLCHEIRNPLSGVYSNIEIAKDYLNSLQTLITHQQAIGLELQVELMDMFTKIRECLDVMKTCCEYQKNILDDNLDVAKIVEKKFLLENKIFDLIAAIQEVVKLFQAKAEQKGLRLNANMPERESLLVKGDLPRIKQIIINLIGNAIKFTSKGHIDITLVVQDNGCDYTQFIITIEDMGIGLNESEISGLFNRFSQASSTISNQYGGSGLGLIIAKSLAELMGGGISVKSKKGEGSTFTCTFRCQNLSEEERKQIGKEKLKIPPPYQKKWICSSRNLRILITDDNEVNRKCLEFILRKEGYECVFAVDGQDAVNQYTLQLNQQIDIILMDIVMPKLNGIEATRLIRQHEQMQNLTRTPIIALTGNALKLDETKALEVGMDDYLTKPYKRDEILEKIAVLLKLDELPNH